MSVQRRAHVRCVSSAWPSQVSSLLAGQVGLRGRRGPPARRRLDARRPASLLEHFGGLACCRHASAVSLLVCTSLESGPSPE
eukprot:1182338-Pyramimonas_sp.AAC.1